MFKTFIIASGAFLGCLLTGCTQYWYQEGKSFQECQLAQQECFQELRKRTDFIGTMDYEFEYMTQCMRDKGYRLVKESELPMEAKRKRPDSTLHWRTKGIAGHLDE
jgi:hypothetical protein